MIELNIDVTDVKRGVIAHGCNCSGGFGSGVAKSVKEKFPSVERAFKAVPPFPELLGQYQIIKVGNDLFVANVFTQVKFGYDKQRYASPQAIQDGLRSLLDNFCFRHGLDLFVPRIGCGLGGLNWEEEVKPIYKTLSHHAKEIGDLNFYVCSP